jgi:hypothetical protein
MKSLIELHKEFEIKIMPDRGIPREEYLAAWEVYNSQPIMGGDVGATISHIWRAIKTAKSPVLIEWLREYARRILSEGARPTLQSLAARWDWVAEFAIGGSNE